MTVKRSIFSAIHEQYSINIDESLSAAVDDLRKDIDARVRCTERMFKRHKILLDNVRTMFDDSEHLSYTTLASYVYFGEVRKCIICGKLLNVRFSEQNSKTDCHHTCSSTDCSKASKKDKFIGQFNDAGETYYAWRSKYASNVHKQLNNLDGFIERHGEEVGTAKYNDYRRRGRTNLRGFVERYGEERGRIRYKKFCEQLGPSEQNMIRIYGDKLGRQKYQQFIQTFSRRTTASKESNHWIRNVVLPHIPANVGYRYADNEAVFGLTAKQRAMLQSDNINQTAVMYDFCCSKLKLIIEYHGIAWHYLESHAHKFVHRNDQRAIECSIIMNKFRQTVAEEHGYRYIAVYSYNAWSKSTRRLIQNIIQEQVNIYIK